MITRDEVAEVMSAVKYWQSNPLPVRCRANEQDIAGRIIPDGNKVWIILEDGSRREQWIGWCLLLEILNDPRSSPLSFD